MCKIRFEGFSIEAINQWAQVRGGMDFDQKAHAAALNEGLVAVINGAVYAAPATEGSARGWVTNLRVVKEMGYISKPLPQEPVAREFGSGDLTVQEAAPGDVEVLDDEELPTVVENELPVVDEGTVPLEVDEHVTAAEPAPEPDTRCNNEGTHEEPSCLPAPEPEPEPAPEPVPEPEPKPPAPPKLNDGLRARVCSLPPYYAALKEPLNKLIDLGADSIVIDTALNLAGKPYNLGQIADYARHITVNAKADRDLMMVVQAAHRAACKVENTSEANSVIMEKILAMTPEAKRPAIRSRLKQQIKEGLDKYWAEAFGQVEASQAAGRTTTPVNLFMHIVGDMKHNSDLAEKRATQRINSFAECRWILEYLPKTPVVHGGSLAPRCGQSSRSKYLPKLRETIERQGYIPLTWVMSLMVDHDYPTIVLAEVAKKMINVYPALERIVTREQFDYAVKVVIETFIDRAARWRESWDQDRWTNHWIGASLMHHAVFAGYQYLQTFKEHLDAGAPFMQEHKEALEAVLNNEDTMNNLKFWYMIQDAWRHGDTPEAAREHYLEEKAYEARAAARAAEIRAAARAAAQAAEGRGSYN